MADKDTLQKLGPEKVLGMYRRMVEIRLFEEKIRYLFLEGKMPGTVHQYIGQEACAVGVCNALEKDDVIASTHRPHGHALAKGISLEAVASELYGKVTGCCRGKGGSMHVGDMDKGMLPAIAIVGGNIPIVAGMAMGFKILGNNRIAVSFFGDGASNEGAFHEGLNAASVYNLPALFVCENNLYGASTAFSRVAKVENIADRAPSYGMRAVIADGMNVFEVYEKTSEAAKLAREGKGPTLLELKTFRLCGHSRRDPNNYMSEQEKNDWKEKDPIPACEKEMISAGIIDPSSIESLRKDVEKTVDAAIDFAREAPEPKPEETFEGLYITCGVPR